MIDTVQTVRYITGDVRDVMATMADGSVDLVLTSPPFLALRSYLPADHPDKHREIGSEPTPAEFIDTLLLLTAEWRRLLAPHGSIAVELGRDAILIDLDERNVELARERIGPHFVPETLAPRAMVLHPADDGGMPW